MLTPDGFVSFLGGPNSNATASKKKTQGTALPARQSHAGRQGSDALPCPVLVC